MGGEVGVGFGDVLEEMGDGKDIYRVTGNNLNQENGFSLIKKRKKGWE